MQPEFAAVMAKPVLNRLTGAGKVRPRPRFNGVLNVVGMHHIHPPASECLLERLAGVVAPPLIHIIERTIRSRCPHQVGQQVGKKREAPVIKSASSISPLRFECRYSSEYLPTDRHTALAPLLSFILHRNASAVFG